MMRVKQIVVDILVDETASGLTLADIVEEDLKKSGHNVVGANFQEDVTMIYEINEPETLEEKDTYWGEELCPHCGKENGFVWEEGTPRYIKCAECGTEMLLCSLCDMDSVDCSKCPYWGE